MATSLAGDVSNCVYYSDSNGKIFCMYNNNGTWTNVGVYDNAINTAGKPSEKKKLFTNSPENLMAGGQLEVLYVNESQGISHIYTGTVGGQLNYEDLGVQTSLTSLVSTQIGVCYFNQSGISDFFFATTDNSIYNLHYQNTWSLRQVAPAGSACPGTNLSGPTAASIFCVGTDWFIHQYFSPANNGVWNANFIGGNAQVLDNSYIASSDIYTMYFFGKDLKLYLMSYVSNVWTNNVLCTGATTATQATKSIFACPNRVYYAGGVDNYIHEYYLNNNTWTQFNIQGSAGNATPVALGPIIGSLDTIAFFSTQYSDICTLVIPSNSWKYTSLFYATNQLGYTISNVVFDTSAIPNFGTVSILTDQNLMQMDQHTNVNYGTQPFTTTITIARMKSATFTNSFSDSTTLSFEIGGSCGLSDIFSVSEKNSVSNTFAFSSTDAKTVEDTATESYTVTIPSGTKIDAIYKTYKTLYDVPYTAILTNVTGYAIDITGVMHVQDGFSKSQFFTFASPAT